MPTPNGPGAGMLQLLRFVRGLTGPVKVCPFRLSLTCLAPMTMHGAFTTSTVQVTSLTKRLSSVTVRVEEIFPLISLACALPGPRESASAIKAIGQGLLFFMTTFLLRVNSPTGHVRKHELYW